MLHSARLTPGKVTHIVSVGGRQRAGDRHQSDVDVGQVVYLSSWAGRRLHRRVDIIFARWEQYGAAVLGWTGSVLYERDLRRWARKKGYSFSSSGLTRLKDGVMLPTPTEGSIYSLLDLPRMPPRLRNAD